MRTRWWALGALCFAELLVMIDNTIVNVALPTMSRDLDAGISGLQWIVDAYTLVFAGLLVTGGYLGDRYGHRRMLLLGIAGFVAVSALAAESQTLGQLITARGGLGLFAALVFPATLALITTIFAEGRERAAAVGVWAATSGVAVAIGPVLGGWLLEHFSWSSVFWVNLPMGVIAAAAIVAVVPGTRPTTVSRFDIGGLLLSIVGLGLLVYSLIEGPHFGWGDPRTIGGLAGAVVVIGLFIWRQLVIAHPILDVRLFANRHFATAAGMVSVAFFALFGFIFLITQFFQAVKGYGPLDAGVRTLPFAVVMAVFSPVAMALSHRFSPRPVVVAGALLMAGGFALVEFSTRTSGLLGTDHLVDVADGHGIGVHLRPVHPTDHGCAQARTSRCGQCRQRHHARGRRHAGGCGARVGAHLGLHLGGRGQACRAWCSPCGGRHRRTVGDGRCRGRRAGAGCRGRRHARGRARRLRRRAALGGVGRGGHHHGRGSGRGGTVARSAAWRVARRGFRCCRK